MAALENELRNNWEKLPKIFVTSSREGTGREEILEYIAHALDEGKALA